MRLVPYDVNQLKPRMKRTKCLEVLEEFEKSGLTCAEIEDFTQKSAKTCAVSFCNAIKRFRMNNISVRTSKGRVFLIRERP